MQVNRRILVVGGSGGIGAAIVAALGEGCLTWSRKEGVDVSDPEQVAAAAESLLAKEGPPFGLVHCAGDFAESPILETDLSSFDRLLESNLKTAFILMRQLVPAMAEAGRGRVILFAAAGADDASAKTKAPLYFAAKAALLSMARSMAAEIGPSGVTVNCISPGLIGHASSHDQVQARLASRVPLGRLGTVEDVIPVVELLLSERGAYMTGCDLVVDGGLSLRGGPG